MTDIENKIIDALLEKKHDYVNKLLKRHLEYFTDNEKSGFLKMIAIYGNLKNFKLLFQPGTDMETLQEAFFESLSFGNLHIANFLIDKGVDLNFKYRDGLNILDYLIGWKTGNLVVWNDDYEKILHRIINNLNYKIESIPMAAAIGTLDDIKKLIEDNKDVDDYLLFNEKTALHIAAAYNNKDMVKYLIGKVEFIDPMDWNNQTPLDVAQNDEIKELLNESGAKTSDEIFNDVAEACEAQYFFKNSPLFKK